MRGTRCLRFRSAAERTCKWTVCLTLDIILCDLWISVAWSGLPVWHAKMQMIKASVEKQSLVVMIKAPPVWRSFVYNVNSRASHPGMNQKREKGPQGGPAFPSS